MKHVLALIVLSLATQVYAGFDLRFHADTPAIEGFKQDVTSSLPVEMTSAINREVSVRFAALDSFETLQNPCLARQNHQLFGWVKNGVITLNKNFLPYLISPNKGSVDFACGHKNFYKLAQATLIHELAHLYDEAKGKVSRSNLYLALSHAGKSLLGVPGIKNRKTDRLPDPYELKDLPEHFAVNAEFFLLDPTYSCRRPNLARFFSAQLKLETKHCAPFSKIRIYDGKSTIVRDLAPANVKAIHYLMADKGKAIMSRFGHAMYRIEMRNSADDLVVGFSGQPDDTVIDGIKGLTGKYASRVTFKPLKQIVNDYTKGELRGLTSYPLKLSDAQKVNFLHEVLALHWEYAGRYFFFTTNCATEAMTLLKATVQTEDVLRRKITTPLGLRKVLRQTGLISDETAERFASYEETLSKVYGRLAPLLPELSYKKFMKSSAADRRAVMESLPSLARVEIYAFLSLELTLGSRAQKDVEGSLMMLIHKLPGQHSMKLVSDETIRLSNELSFGHNVAAGYGVPLAGEFRDNADSFYATTEARLQELFTQMGVWLRDEHYGLLTEMKQGQENLAYIQERLRALK